MVTKKTPAAKKNWDEITYTQGYEAAEALIKRSGLKAANRVVESLGYATVVPFEVGYRTRVGRERVAV